MLRSIFVVLLWITCSNAFVAPSSRLVFTNRATRQQFTPAAMLPDSLQEVIQSSGVLLSEDEGVGYSKVSYYTILGLYLMSFPGLWSQIKRSTDAKIKRKTYVSKGENAPEGKGLRQEAGEIMACK